MEDKIYKIMDFCMEFNIANIENNIIAMPNYENGKQIVILLAKKDNESFANEFIIMYQETFKCLIKMFEITSWNTKSGFYTMMKFKENDLD